MIPRLVWRAASCPVSFQGQKRDILHTPIHPAQSLLCADCVLTVRGYQKHKQNLCPQGAHSWVGLGNMDLSNTMQSHIQCNKSNASNARSNANEDEAMTQSERGTRSAQRGKNGLRKKSANTAKDDRSQLAEQARWESQAEELHVWGQRRPEDRREPASFWELQVDQNRSWKHCQRQAQEKGLETQKPDHEGTHEPWQITVSLS